MTLRISSFDASILSQIAFLAHENGFEVGDALLSNIEGKRAKEIGEALLAEPAAREQFSPHAQRGAAALEQQVHVVKAKIKRFVSLDITQLNRGCGRSDHND